MISYFYLINYLCYNKLMLKKKGDTLVEVTLAVGIFSLVAIAVVAVMNGGIAGAQTSLETTLAREEIDTQAEALRFIQTSAAADETSADQRYYRLWQEIIDEAYDTSTGWTAEDQAALLQFSPSTCNEAYDENNLGYRKGFVINPRMLGKYGDAKSLSAAKNLINSVYISKDDTNSDGSKKLIPATTYPRLVFGGSVNEWSGDLLENNLQDNLYHAEGIYVVAVRDPETTNFASENEDVAAYYDFYIRTCWYGTDANRPTTISTVIRLYDPNAIDKVDSSGSSVIHHSREPLRILYDGNAGTISGWSSWQTCSVYNEYTCLATSNKPTRPNYRFVGWSTTPGGPAEFGSGNNVLGGKTVEEYVADLVAKTGRNQLSLYAVWHQDVLTYDFNGSTYDGGSWTQICGGNCQIKSSVPLRSGYEFVGWSTTRGGSVNYYPGQFINLEGDTTIYAVWKERNETLTARLSFPSNDCDSHVTGQKSDGSSFHAFYGAKVGSDINGLVLASLDVDRTSGGTETFTINTLGGRNYYYYVHNYRGCSLSSATVTLSGPYTGTRTFYYNSAYATSGDWHVFAIKDGQLVTGW